MIAVDLQNCFYLPNFSIFRFFGLFGNIFIDALKLLDTNTVKKLTTKSDRFIIKIINPKKFFKGDIKREAISNYNYCFIFGNYCDCAQNTIDCLSLEKLLLCKHLLAAKLAFAIGEYEVCSIEEKEFKEIMFNIMKIK